MSETGLIDPDAGRLSFEFIVACTVKCGRGWELTEHKWPDHRLLLVRGGRGTLVHEGWSHPLRRGSVVFGLPGETYSIVQDPRMRLSISVLRFQRRTARGRHAVLSEFRRALCMQPACFPLIEQIAIRLTREVPRVPVVAGGLVEALLLSLLGLLGKDRPQEESARSPDLAYQDLKPALDHVQSSGDTRQGVAALARLCGLSPGVFRRRMMECHNQTPRQFLQKARLDRAITMLLESPYKIEAISFELGYGDAAHFSRQFKSHTGMSPGAFRASYQ